MSDWIVWGIQLAVAVIGGSAVGAVIASEISWRRTEKKIRSLIERLSKDEKIKEQLKTVAKEMISTALEEVKQRAPELQAVFLMKVNKPAELPKELLLAETRK
jgi:predicted acylesterase/phospholipase RssA